MGASGLYGSPTTSVVAGQSAGKSCWLALLCRAPAVVELIWSEIEKVNRDFARVETIRRFRLIEQQLTAEDDELTPTMKLKRTFVNEKYKALIDDMYAEAA